VQARTRTACISPRRVQVGNGATALHAAVENGREGVVRVLLEVRQCDAHGLRNMTERAVCLFVCSILRQPYGVQARARQSNSMEGATPLIIAAQYNQPRIAKVR
jgi:ankyrin repeat protein